MATEDSHYIKSGPPSAASNLDSWFREESHYSLFRILVTVKMLATHVILILLTGTLALAAVADSLVLCPQFPSCCYPRDHCHALCPSCREARFFRNGVRLFPKNPRGCSIGGNVINPDPFAFPNSPIFPSPPICI
nr:uncharacterized protein LOC113823037 [Penaeus vannamei]